MRICWFSGKKNPKQQTDVMSWIISHVYLVSVCVCTMYLTTNIWNLEINLWHFMKVIVQNTQHRGQEAYVLLLARQLFVIIPYCIYFLIWYTVNLWYSPFCLFSRACSSSWSTLFSSSNRLMRLLPHLISSISRRKKKKTYLKLVCHMFFKNVFTLASKQLKKKKTWNHIKAYFIIKRELHYQHKYIKLFFI